MPKPKRKLTAAEKRAKKERQKKHEWIFINGKQVRIKRPPTIEGLPVDEFIARNADPMLVTPKRNVGTHPALKPSLFAMSRGRSECGIRDADLEMSISFDEPVSARPLRPTTGSKQEI